MMYTEPILYHESLFRMVDGSLPDYWEQSCDDEGGWYRRPREWSTRGYWEQFFDGLAEAVEHFWRILAQLYPQTSHEHRREG